MIDRTDAPSVPETCAEYMAVAVDAWRKRGPGVLLPGAPWQNPIPWQDVIRYALGEIEKALLQDPEDMPPPECYHHADGYWGHKL